VSPSTAALSDSKPASAGDLGHFESLLCYKAEVFNPRPA